jgi:multiple sugar transport system substrate-binding protein
VADSQEKTMPQHLRGMAWEHPRGYDPMVATARAYEESNPGTQISWDKRSLQAFADFPIEQLAEEYDLIVIDHPHVGLVARQGHLVALDEHAPDGALEALAEQSLGGSHESYQYEGHQWALAIDAAAQVAAYRPDLLSEVPTSWPEVVDLAKADKVLWPVKPVDALMGFFTLAANRGTPCAESPERLLAPADGLAVLEAMRTLSEYVPRECLGMNPIETLDRMSTDDSYAYCPLLYGYSNYARDGFREHLIRFTNIPALGSDGPRGSTLGGAGIAVSATSSHVEVAADYAFWVASAECQKGIYFESGGQPGNAVAWTDDDVNAASHGYFRDTYETLQRAWLRPRYDAYLAFQDKGGRYVNDFLAGRAGAEETLSRLEQAYAESLP